MLIGYIHVCAQYTFIVYMYVDIVFVHVQSVYTCTCTCIYRLYGSVYIYSGYVVHVYTIIHVFY